jgi:hypothetical protein
MLNESSTMHNPREGRWCGDIGARGAWKNGLRALAFALRSPYATWLNYNLGSQ